MFASSKTIILEKKIKANKEVLFPLELVKNSYIRGSFILGTKVDRIDLLDKNKHFLRRMDQPNKLQNKLIFVTNDSQKFYIKLKNKSKENTFKLSIDKILPIKFKENKKVEIISDIIKNEKKNLLTNKNTKEFWEKIKKIGTPLVEPLNDKESILTFLYQGAKHNVRLFGGPSHEHVYFNRLENSDIWFKSFVVKKGIRMSYQIAPDVPTIDGTSREQRMAILATSQMDPLNKYPYKMAKDLKLDKYMTNSTFEIKDKEYKDWGVKANSPKGSLKNYKIKSDILNNTRNITIYKPSNFDLKKDYTLLFVFDGVEYQVKIDTPTILDNLIYKNKIKPTIAVFIDNPTRNSRALELPSNKEFADFMAKELLPFVEQKTNMKFKAKNTTLTGSSYGGLASAFVAFTYPQYFGKVLSQSGSFWKDSNNNPEPEWLTRQIAKSNKKDIKFYLNAGTYETGYFSIDILESNRHLRTVLESKGYDFIYKEFQSGHDYYAWKVNLADGLIALEK
ncbi:alpha/beta hydrolase-fold protein [Arcobacter sp. CECT 8983]|uniref:alpha/beta hydrolase-fold protein n=1 Tax=Arcobacter sp. CECT 8983 TaxID=2044508 RepID=UPI0013E91D0B|nr:alpha/beta hydrolase-fold protein [Arcobacter sp. CECT 8983]